MAPRRNQEEALAMRAILKEFKGTVDVALFRNSVGEAEEWSDTEDGLKSRRVTYGLETGSPDLVGVLTVAGPRGPVAVWLGLEVKSSTGRVRPAQREWLAAAKRRGICAAVVRSVDEVRAVIDAERRRVREVLGG